MHRHGYQGKKFGRQRDQRQALLVGLAESLILKETIETTLPKAKEAAKYTEKLITKAKVGSLHARRQLIAQLSTIQAVNKLVDEIAPKLAARNSGYLRVKRTVLRRGDNAQLASVSFVDDLQKTARPKIKEASSAEPTKAVKPAAKPKKTSAVKTVKKSPPRKAAVKTAKKGKK